MRSANFSSPVGRTAAVGQLVGPDGGVQGHAPAHDALHESRCAGRAVLGEGDRYRYLGIEGAQNDGTHVKRAPEDFGDTPQPRRLHGSFSELAFHDGTIGADEEWLELDFSDTDSEGVLDRAYAFFDGVAFAETPMTFQHDVGRDASAVFAGRSHCQLELLLRHALVEQSVSDTVILAFEADGDIERFSDISERRSDRPYGFGRDPGRSGFHPQHLGSLGTGDAFGNVAHGLGRNFAGVQGAASREIADGITGMTHGAKAGREQSIELPFTERQLAHVTVHRPLVEAEGTAIMTLHSPFATAGCQDVAVGSELVVVGGHDAFIREVHHFTGGLVQGSSHLSCAENGHGVWTYGCGYYGWQTSLPELGGSEGLQAVGVIESHAPVSIVVGHDPLLRMSLLPLTSIPII